MRKENIVMKMREARLAHVRWIQRAKSLVNGLEIKEEDIPLTSDSCQFGKWFYSDGQILLAIFNEKPVQELERLHNRLHEEYMNIFKIYFDPSTIGFFTKLLKQKKRVSQEEHAKALLYLKSLEEISGELIKNLNIMETKINMVDSKSLENYL